MNKKTSVFPVALLVAGLLFLTPACGGREGAGEADSKVEGGGDVVATFAGEEMSLDDFQAEVEKLPPQVKPLLSSPERRRKFLENFILSTLLVDDAKRRGIDKEEEIQKQLDDMEKRLILQKVFKDLQQAVTVTDEDVKAYYDASPGEFTTAEIKASHILLEDEASAQEVLEKVKADPDSFAALAKALSKDTATAPNGGDLGFFGRGRMVPEFEQAAFGLEKPGDLSEVVKSPFGFHVIQLTEKKEGDKRPFEQVTGEIRTKLLQERQRNAVEAHFEQVKSEAKLLIDDQVLAKYDPGPPGPAGIPGAGIGHPAPPPETSPSAPEEAPPAGGEEGE
jgi:peptidyl-prolyl cis-trans isomerase C